MHTTHQDTSQATPTTPEEQQKIDRVTHALTGEFYIGQRVRTRKYGSLGLIEAIDRPWVYVRFEDKTCLPYLLKELVAL